VHDPSSVPAGLGRFPSAARTTRLRIDCLAMAAQIAEGFRRLRAAFA
jgi:hypothetical protein